MKRSIYVALCIGAVLVACGGPTSPKPPDPQPTETPPISIITDSIENAYSGKTYAQNLAAANGQGTLTWTLSASAPDYNWLQIDGATGTLSGNPTALLNATNPIEVDVVDANGNKASKTYLLSVLACTDGDTNECYKKAGVDCMKGTQTCKNKKFGECQLGTDKADSSQCAADPRASCGKHADQYVNGQCQCGNGPPCASGFTCCGGKCVDTDKDLDHCGSCTTPCDTDRLNVVRTCNAGTCSYPCQDGWKRCPEGSDIGDCNTNITNDRNNCGGCGNTCAADSNKHVAKTACQEMKCVIASCESETVPWKDSSITVAFQDCDKNIDNGCERDLNPKLNFCGCNGECPDGSICDSKTNKCVAHNCPPQFADCNGIAADGCEASFLNDKTCGSCTNACPASGINAPGPSHCIPSGDLNNPVRCAFPPASCADGFLDADQDASNGCELNIATQNICGPKKVNCWQAYDSTNVASWNCDHINSTCSIGSCQSGWANCFGANDCETSLESNYACGSCLDWCTGSSECRPCSGNDPYCYTCVYDPA